jgi:hypothetical protein
MQGVDRLIFAFRPPERPSYGRSVHSTGTAVPGWRHFGSIALDPPADTPAAAALICARDGFADPPALVVRDDVLAAVGGPERVRAGALADLVARIEAAGHHVESRSVPVAPRRATPAGLLREGSGRLWLFRRHPERHPLPRPRDTCAARWALLAIGALRANAGR